MKKLRFGVVGAGFWARYQIAAWQELEGAECVAICDRARDKAAAFAQHFEIPAVYDDPETMLQNERLDFLEVITTPETHAEVVFLAAARKIATICQKPIAPTLMRAREMVARMNDAGAPFFIHENFRWQTPLRALKAALDTNEIGEPFRARLFLNSGFPVFKNQPYLADIEQFIIADLGTHTLDLARFFFGEAVSVYCQTHRAHPDIKGEDVATILLRMANGMTVTVEMAFAENFHERESFPETLAFVEGTRGTVELANDYWLRVTTQNGTQARRVAPPRYAWANPDYNVVHASIVPCNANFLAALQSQGTAETTGTDNLKTLELVFACYESAALHQVVMV